MSSTVTIDSSGRLVIPRNIRDQLHLHNGSRLNLEVKGDGVFLVPVPDEIARVVKLGGRLVIESAEPLNDEAIRKALVADRDERIAKLSGSK